jgi:3-oxoacyl-[acyl-carrier protein] reductase
MDPIQSLLRSSFGPPLLRRIGVAPPPALRRYVPGRPLLDGPVVVGPSSGRLAEAAEAVLKQAEVEVLDREPVEGTVAALVFDASDVAEVADLGRLHEFFSASVRRLSRSGRVLVLGVPPTAAASSAAVAQRALEGFTRSLAKELRDGATANLVLVEPGAEDRAGSTLRFLLSARSAFVDGQVVRVGSAVPAAAAVAEAGLPGWDRPLDGCTVAVTGAARGIGAAMVQTLAADGAHVIGVDVAMLAGDLEKVTRQAGGSHLVADVTLPDTAARIARAARGVGAGALHGIVHNAGITRDRRLVNLDRRSWDLVLAVNLQAPQRITDELVADGVLGQGGRVVGISSIAGIAGNPGQTSYAASKAGVIGLVDVLAPALAPRGITVNAIAPGFIETAMTQKVPLAVREGGRWLSSLKQGGLPVDVAQAASWLLWPASSGVTGNVVWVCGQALIGA